MRTIDIVALILLIVGGLNWGLVGLFGFDLVAAIFGGVDAFLSRVIYTLVGLSAIWVAFQWKQMHSRWAREEPTTRRRAA